MLEAAIVVATLLKTVEFDRSSVQPLVVTYPTTVHFEGDVPVKIVGARVRT